MDTIGIGMIGAGSISNAHLSALQGRDDVELVGIADLNESQAISQAEKFGAKVAVTDYRALIERDDVHAVVVGIPTHFHPEASIAAFERGKHVLCEKPMARTLEECRRMAESAAANNAVFQIAFVRRFDPEWGKLRELIHEGRVGRPCQWRRFIVGSTPGAPYGTWYSDSAVSNGPLDESGIHDFDFVRYTFGDVKAVTANVWKMGRTGDVLDMGTVIVDFVSGDQAVIQWSWSLPPGCVGGSANGMDVVGPEGAIHAPRCIEGKNYETRVTGASGADETISFVVDRGEGAWFHGQMSNFLASIRGEETPRGTAADGLKAQQIITAAFESSETGRRVGLTVEELV